MRRLKKKPVTLDLSKLPEFQQNNNGGKKSDNSDNLTPKSLSEILVSDDNSTVSTLTPPLEDGNEKYVFNQGPEILLNSPRSSISSSPEGVASSGSPSLSSSMKSRLSGEAGLIRSNSLKSYFSGRKDGQEAYNDVSEEPQKTSVDSLDLAGESSSFSVSDGSL